MQNQSSIPAERYTHAQRERSGESPELSPNYLELIPNSRGESPELLPNYLELISNSRGIRYHSGNIRAIGVGFTLLELLVVIAILAVLAAVTAAVINPAELMARARDTERLTELNSIHRNLGLFLATAPSPSLGLANRVYIISLCPTPLLPAPPGQA